MFIVLLVGSAGCLCFARYAEDRHIERRKKEVKSRDRLLCQQRRSSIFLVGRHREQWGVVAIWTPGPMGQEGRLLVLVVQYYSIDPTGADARDIKGHTCKLSSGARI